MKKLSLILAAGFAALSMNAEGLHFLINGQEVQNGSKVDITSYFESEGESFIIDPKMEVVCDEGGKIVGTVTNVKCECIPALDADWNYGAEVNLTWCGFTEECVPVALGSSLTKEAVLPAGDTIEMRLEYQSFQVGFEQNIDELKINAESTVQIAFGGKNYNLTLVVNRDLSGVNGLYTDPNAPAEYFDLQGRRVNNPENGLYIVRQGDKVTKVILK